jgi:hypothetical protein
LALHFRTKTPKKLLATYKRAVDQGHVTVWSYDTDGDFAHTSEQWAGKAWLRPRIVPATELIFFILTPKETSLSSNAYAVYHGRFIESMLRHCDSLFVDVIASSMPEEGDSVG